MNYSAIWIYGRRFDNPSEAAAFLGAIMTLEGAPDGYYYSASMNELLKIAEMNPNHALNAARKIARENAGDINPTGKNFWEYRVFKQLMERAKDADID